MDAGAVSDDEKSKKTPDSSSANTNALAKVFLLRVIAIKLECPTLSNDSVSISLSSTPTVINQNGSDNSQLRVDDTKWPTNTDHRRAIKEFRQVIH